MQCRVTGVDVMTNGDEEVRPWILATRSDPKERRNQTGRLIEHSRDLDVVTRGDRGEEREQRTIDVIGSSAWPGHRYRLSNLRPGCLDKARSMSTVVTRTRVLHTAQEFRIPNRSPSCPSHRCDELPTGELGYSGVALPLRRWGGD